LPDGPRAGAAERHVRVAGHKRPQRSGRDRARRPWRARPALAAAPASPWRRAVLRSTAREVRCPLVDVESHARRGREA
jgi:hypothetical protein